MVEIALVGAGGMAGTHARGYSRIPGARLTGVMDIREEAARNLAEEQGAQAFTDFAAMVDALRPDVVDVCVPTPFHADYVCLATEFGVRGIVVEKPMGRTVADCERMITACEKAGVPLFVAQVVRFFPEFITARSQVDAGAVGEVAAVRMRRGGPFPRGWENWYGRLDWSGGTVLDLAIHDLDWLRWTFGEVERVFAGGMVAGLPEDAVVEQDYSLITLRFKSGVIGHVESTWADPGGFKVALEIAGDAGLLEYNFNQPTQPPYVAALATLEGDPMGVPIPESPTAVNPYEAELSHFLGCLERGTPPDVSPHDGLEAVRIAEAALQSIRTGLPVTL